MSERLRLFNRYWDPIWDSGKAPFGMPAYRLIPTWVNASIDYDDGTRWIGRLYRCREGIRREAYPDPNIFRNLIAWPEPWSWTKLGIPDV